MIKAFLFDYGGVITPGGGRSGNVSDLTDKLARNLSITTKQAEEIVGKANWVPFMMGKITEDVFWSNVEKRFNKEIPLELRNVWNTWDEMRPYPEMTELVKRLSSDYKVGLLSNAIPPTAKSIRQNGGYDDFGFVILSYEVKFAKPDIEIYKLAMSKLPGISPEEVVFIDDQEVCLVPARELGMKTILAQNPAQIINNIDSLLS